MQQQYGQHVRDADYQNYQNAVEWPFRQVDFLKSMLTGQPTAGQTTSQTSGGNSGWMNALGAILGAFTPG
jgi:hypothetical protein